MATSPWNLALRFLLELAALAGFGVWGWLSFGWIAAIGAPGVAAALWGVFNVPGDPTRSGRAPVPVPGWLRLGLELVILYGAVWALFDVGYGPLGKSLGLITALHYALSFDRLGWLLAR